MSLQWTLDIEVANGGSGFRAAANHFKQIREEANRLNQDIRAIGKNMALLKSPALSGKSFLSDLPRHSNNLQVFERRTASAMTGLSKFAAVAAGVVVSAVAATANAISDTGDKLINLFSERNTSLRIYKTLLGDAKRAEQEYFKAGVLAQKTDLTQSQIQFTQQRLITQGFRGEKELDNALLSVADVATAAPENRREMVINSMLNAFKKMKGRDRTSLMEMKELGRGIQESLIFEELAKIKGVSVKDIIGDPTKKGKSRGMISRGLVSGEEGIVATQRAILRQFNTKKLGEFATAGSGDLKALLTNQEEAWENLAKSFDNKALPGIQKYTDSLKKLVDVIFNAESGGGNLKLVVQDLGNTFANTKSVFADFTAAFLEAFSDSYVQELKEMGYTIDADQEKFNNLAYAARELGTSLGGVGKWVADAKLYFNDLAPTVDMLRAMFERLGNAIKGIGSAISGAKGLVTGFVDDVKSIFKKDSSLAKMTDDQRLKNNLLKLSKGYSDAKKVVGGVTGATIETVKAGWTPLTHEYKKPVAATLMDEQKKIEETKNKNEEKRGSNIKKEQALLNDVKSARGKSGGSGIPGFDLGSFRPNYNSLDTMLLKYENIGPGVSRRQITSSSTSYPQSTGARGGQIVVENINIKIDGSSTSPQAVAEAVYDKFVSQVNRLNRVPSQEVL